MVEYSANARGYMLGTAFMLACAQMLHYARERDNRAAWIGGALAAAVSIFSVPTMVVPLLGVALWLIGLTAIERKPSFGRLLRRAVPAAFIAAAATLILYFPYWVIEGPRSLFVTPSMLLPSPDATFFTAWSEMLGAFRLICDFALSTPVLAGACVLALIGIITAPEAAALFAGHLIAATAFLFLTHFGPIVARIYIPFFPFFALLAGRGVSRLERVSHRSTPVLALLVLMAAGAAGWNSLDLPERLQQDPIGAVRDARCRAAEILDRLEPGDGVVGTGLNAPLIYDLIREGRKRGRLMVHGTAPLPETQDYGMVQECPAATCAAQPRGYIFVTSNNSDTVPPLLAQLPIRLVLPFTHCAKGIVR